MYETDDDKVPFSSWMDWLEDHDLEAYGVVMTRLDRVSDGNFGDCVAVGGGVLELRIDFASGYRVYFGRVGDDIVILLGGGTKKTQRVDIQVAQKNSRAFNAN